RGDFPPYGALGVGYRADLLSVIGRLGEPASRGRRVLATLDHQLFVWWVAFRHQPAYLVDPFVSPLGDQVIERRLVRFCKLVGASRAQLGDVLAERTVNVFWLGHNKYQASRGHSFAPISEYAPATQRSILTSSPFDNWHIALPRGELERLLALYDAESPG